MDEIGYNHRHGRSFYIDRPEGTGDWLMLIIKSPAYFRVDGKDIKTSSCAFILYEPGAPQHYHPAADEYFDDWIHFGPSNEELELIIKLGIPLNRPVNVNDITDISAIARNMCFEYYSSNQYKNSTVDLYFHLLLYKLGEKVNSAEKKQKASESLYFEKLMWIRESIYRWPSRDYSIDDMASELSLSRSRFQHLYTATFGVSVNKDVITSRLRKAAEMLRTTDLSVKDIGIIIGYGNTSYFVKLFGSAYGLPPLQYRNAENAEGSHSESEPQKKSEKESYES